MAYFPGMVTEHWIATSSFLAPSKLSVISMPVRSYIRASVFPPSKFKWLILYYRLLPSAQHIQVPVDPGK